MATTHANRQKAAATAKAEAEALGAQKQNKLTDSLTAANEFNLREKQEAAARRAKDRKLSVVKSSTTGVAKTLYSPPGVSSQRIANGFPPAYHMVLVTLVIALIGNVRKDSFDNITDSNPTDWFKKIFAGIILAIVLGMLDRGSMSGPVRAFSALLLLVAIFYYTPYFGVTKKVTATKNTTPTTVKAGVVVPTKETASAN